MARQCPSCGAREGEKPFVKNFCAECFPRYAPALIALPKEIVLLKCPRCSRFRKGSEWIEGEAKTLFEEKIKSAHPIIELRARLDENLKRLFVEAVLEVEGQKVAARASTRAEVKKTICEDCARMASGYHEAIIQLRGNRKRVERLAEKLLRRLGRETFVTSEVEKREGIDLLVGSKKTALQALAELHLPYAMANKLVGVREGKHVHRTTVCIRI